MPPSKYSTNLLTHRFCGQYCIRGSHDVTSAGVPSQYECSVNCCRTHIWYTGQASGLGWILAIGVTEGGDPLTGVITGRPGFAGQHPQKKKTAKPYQRQEQRTEIVVPTHVSIRHEPSGHRLSPKPVVDADTPSSLVEAIPPLSVLPGRRCTAAATLLVKLYKRT